MLVILLNEDRAGKFSQRLYIVSVMALGHLNVIILLSHNQDLTGMRRTEEKPR